MRTVSRRPRILKSFCVRTKWGERCVDRLEGMFAFAIWDAKRGEMFVARDRFGIKPFYYACVQGGFYFGSEVKALTPFLNRVETDANALHDYFAFQFCLGEKTLFAGVRQLKPATLRLCWARPGTETAAILGSAIRSRLGSYRKYFVEQVREKLQHSVDMHMRSDVEVGAYISGGVDSSLVAAMARHGRRSPVSRDLGNSLWATPSTSLVMRRPWRTSTISCCIRVDITEDDFVNDIAKVIYHLDQPVAGPGSFPQYAVSRLAKDHVKVVLGGQGSDEMFGVTPGI